MKVLHLPKEYRNLLKELFNLPKKFQHLLKEYSNLPKEFYNLLKKYLHLPKENVVNRWENHLKSLKKPKKGENHG